MLAGALELPCSLQASQFDLPPLKDEEVFAEELAALTNLELDELPGPWQSVDEISSTPEVFKFFRMVARNRLRKLGSHHQGCCEFHFPPALPHLDLYC